MDEKLILYRIQVIVSRRETYNYSENALELHAREHESLLMTFFVGGHLDLRNSKTRCKLDFFTLLEKEPQRMASILNLNIQVFSVL